MNEKDYVKQVFSKNMESYITSSTHSTISDLSLIIKWLQLKPNMKMLDIATGGGHVAKHLAKHVEHVIATDLTKEMLETTSIHLGSYKNISYAIACIGN